MRLDEIKQLKETHFTANGHMIKAADALDRVRRRIADCSEESPDQDWSTFAALSDAEIMDLLMHNNGNVDKVCHDMEDTFYDENGQPLVQEAKPRTNMSKKKSQEVIDRVYKHMAGHGDRPAPAGKTAPPPPQPKKKH